MEKQHESYKTQPQDKYEYWKVGDAASSSRGPVLYLFYAPPAAGGGWNAVPLSRIDVVDQKLLKLPAYLCN